MVYPKHTMSQNYIICHVGNVTDGTQILLQATCMNITMDQIIAARSEKPFSKKWPNGKIPYTFDVSEYEVGLFQTERNIVKKIAQRFNKDLNGCASIR